MTRPLTKFGNAESLYYHPRTRGLGGDNHLLGTFLADCLCGHAASEIRAKADNNWAISSTRGGLTGQAGFFKWQPRHFENSDHCGESWVLWMWTGNQSAVVTVNTFIVPLTEKWKAAAYLSFFNALKTNVTILGLIVTFFSFIVTLPTTNLWVHIKLRKCCTKCFNNEFFSF